MSKKPDCRVLKILVLSLKRNRDWQFLGRYGIHDIHDIHGFYKNSVSTPVYPYNRL